MHGMIHKKLSYALSFLFLSVILLCGCSGGSKEIPEEFAPKDKSPIHTGSPRDNTPRVLTPEASGSSVLGNDTIVLDVSHTESGYFMVRYLGGNDKVKLRILGPDESEYVYLLSGSQEYETFPFSRGSGTYQIQILEHTSQDMYAVAYSSDLSVSIQDEFTPFLYPNQYVNFTEQSLTVSKGSELAKDAYSDLEVIENIYRYVTKEISYDSEKAANVAYGYLPVVDDTLQSKKGICFDYAAVMSAMLRSQGIPTKLEVGYSGDAYHAWISAYIKESGWVDNIIRFDGNCWTLMDPTLAAANSAESVKEYIGDGSNYTVKYSY